MSAIVGFDPGAKNATLAIMFDDGSYRVVGVDFTIYKGERIKLTSLTIPAVVSHFIKENERLWPMVGAVGGEDQMSAVYRELVAVFLCMIRERFPHIVCGLTSPKAVRAFFGIQIVSGPQKGRYERRKAASIDMIPIVIAPEHRDIFKKTFTKTINGKTRCKLDDAIEAVLIAIYIMYHPKFHEVVIKGRPTTDKPYVACTIRDIFVPESSEAKQQRIARNNPDRKVKEPPKKKVKHTRS
jgi:hypothetical protein